MNQAAMHAPFAVLEGVDVNESEDGRSGLEHGSPSTTPPLLPPSTFSTPNGISPARRASPAGTVFATTCQAPDASVRSFGERRLCRNSSAWISPSLIMGQPIGV
jgi:hypothetical protein